MAKLHARLSVEIDVTEEQLRYIYYTLGNKKHNYEPNDVDINILPCDIDLNSATVCDWDYGGYVPGSWLEYDAVEAKIATLEEV